MRARLLFFAVFFSGLSVLFPCEGRASVYEKLVDDVFPSSPPRAEFSSNEFYVAGVESLPAGSEADIDLGSVQWSRIDDRLVLPRVRVLIKIAGAEGGSVSVFGRATPLRVSTDGKMSGEILVPLVSGTASEFKVVWSKGGKETTKKLRLEKRTDELDRVVIDSSCSSSLLDLRHRSAKGVVSPGVWTYFDCRWIRETSAATDLPVLDVAVFWNGRDETLRVNGSAIRSTEPSIFHLRLRPQNAPLLIETEDGQMYELSFRLPPEMNLGFVGIGVGPYQYRLHGRGAEVSTIAPIVTLYGSYRLGESVRLTAFNATAIHKNFFMDTGLYVKTDSFRFFDQRIQVYLMFGANFVGFKFPDGAKFKAGVPQGFEAVMRDVMGKNRSATLGAFVYPEISGKSYYNVWIRYGSPHFFGEVNYLAIRDQFDGASIFSRSVGISIGFPLARLF